MTRIDWQVVIIDRNRTTRAGCRFVYKVIDEHGYVFDMYDSELNHYYVGYKAPTESEHVYVAKKYSDEYEIAKVSAAHAIAHSLASATDRAAGGLMNCV